MSEKERPIYETEDWKATFELEGLIKLIKKRIFELRDEILEKYKFLKIDTGGKIKIEDGEGGFYDDIFFSNDLVIIHPKMNVVGKIIYENFASDLSLFRRDSLRKH